MPYLKNDQRANLEIDLFGKLVLPQTAGELNYLFTKIAILFIERNGLDYTNINNVVGALEGAKLEFYRRVAIPYENQKIRENGDVYPDSIAPRIA